MTIEKLACHRLHADEDWKSFMESIASRYDVPVECVYRIALHLFIYNDY